MASQKCSVRAVKGLSSASTLRGAGPVQPLELPRAILLGRLTGARQDCPQRGQERLAAGPATGPVRIEGPYQDRGLVDADLLEIDRARSRTTAQFRWEHGPAARHKLDIGDGQRVLIGMRGDPALVQL